MSDILGNNTSVCSLNSEFPAFDILDHIDLEFKLTICRMLQPHSRQNTVLSFRLYGLSDYDS